ncbi:uncharacterized protein LOC107047972 [Diachasma alloeum]|uniref:uncharacterized protein LOC107047972 n=1 Tax=Diachasma alloeum TaxID=454923 RepID=UPI0007381D29|nr:uncharacterized protein LOC107047972 [Diachasma alloeum]
MFRQIKVHEDDWDYQRNLWYDEADNLMEFQLTTVTYGTTSAPWLSLRVCEQLVKDEGHKYPKAVAAMTRGKFVDDIYDGADTEEELEKKDTLQITVKAASKKAITKRIILSEIAEIYDPISIVAPVIARAKIIMQEVWKRNVNWDDRLSDDTILIWQTFREELEHLSKINIPRWLHLRTEDQVEIHGFADASNLAMGAVIYLRVTSPTSPLIVTLVAAKTKVAPLKKITIPRLELGAALILAELTTKVQKLLDLEHINPTLWSDSSVALTWIKAPPSLQVERLCPTSSPKNPRYSTSSNMETRPPWLSSSPEYWPASSIKKSSPEASIEERTAKATAYPTQPVTEHNELLLGHSNLSELLKNTALARRACDILLKRRRPDSSPVTPIEIESARKHWLTYTQSTFFAEEIHRIRENIPLPNGYPLLKLMAYLDEEGILRVGGRLSNAAINKEEQHQAIIPRSSKLTQLIINDAHGRTLHGGTQLTLSLIRQKYWIMGGRTPVRSFILKCITCARHRAQRAQQIMGQLPSMAVNPSRAFQHSGVDFAGPFTVRRWRSAGAVTYQSYVAVFVCFATSAVHLELVTDLSTEGFLASYKRFAARRGICTTITSDNGKNFVGASKELQRLFDSASQAVLNSRPLCPLTNDPEDPAALTPGHFLIGEPLISVPEPNLKAIKTGRLNRWQLITQKSTELTTYKTLSWSNKTTTWINKENQGNQHIMM